MIFLVGPGHAARPHMARSHCLLWKRASFHLPFQLTFDKELSIDVQTRDITGL
jgi:hypothetical protein